MGTQTVFEQRARWIVVCFCFVAVYVYLSRQVGWTIDDAYITYRYAENVVAGHGPVYNVGEPVEGYTCFWWMTLLSVAGIGGIEVPLFAKIAGMLSVFGSVALVAFWDRADPSFSRTEALLAALCLATSAPFIQWGPSGMETALFCLLALATVFEYLRLFRGGDVSSAVGVGMLGTLLTMTRPNGVVLLFVLLAHAVLNRERLGRPKLFAMVGTFVLAYGAYFAWRLSYYGHLLPNTFYAKVGTSNAQFNRGARYLVRAMPAFGLLVAPIFASWGRPPLGSNATAKASDETKLLLGLVVTHLVYVVSVGGDNFPAHRFLVVVVPFLCLLSMRAIPQIAPTTARRALLTTLVVGYNLAASAFDPETRVRVRKDYVAGDGQLVGRWLADNTEPGALIATNSAGALAYYSKRPIVDMLGLNDATIAHTPVERMGAGKAGHEKGNGFYVLSREPDYVLFGPPKGSPEPMFKGGKELFALDSFKKRYVQQRTKLGDDVYIVLYRRLSDEELEKKRRAAKRKAQEKKKKSKKAKASKKRPVATGNPARASNPPPPK